MIKQFQIDDIVSFQGNVDFGPVDKTTVAWVDNNTYQAIIEHPDGHSGDEIPGKGLHAKKTYAFVKTDHLDFFAESEEEKRTENQPVKDVSADKVEEVQNEKPSEKTAGPGPDNMRPAKPTVVVSDSLILFKDQVSEENHELIDDLINRALEYEGKKSHISTEPKKEEAPTEEAHEEDTRSAAEKIAAHEAEAAEIEAQEQRLKSQAEQRAKIHDMVVNGLMKNVLIIKSGPVVKNGKRTTAFVCFLGEEGLVTLDHKEDMDSIVNYFQNVPADFTDFAAAMATVGSNSKENENENAESETKSGKNDTKSEKSDTESEENGNITYKKTGGAEPDDSEPASESDSVGDLKAKYHSKLIGLSGIGPAKANLIMKIYPTPEDLITGYKEKNLDKNEGFSATMVKSLKTACKGKYFLN